MNRPLRLPLASGFFFGVKASSGTSYRWAIASAWSVRPLASRKVTDSGSITAIRGTATTIGRAPSQYTERQPRESTRETTRVPARAPPAWWAVIRMVTLRFFRHGGAYSMTIAMAVGRSPPSPRPASIRAAPKVVTLSAMAQPAEPSEKITTPAMMIFRRPMRSVISPELRAPISMPKVVRLPMSPAVTAVMPRLLSARRWGRVAP